ncbi:MAG: nucleotidyltransferase domain-containing protein [Thermovirgaceae bacterium]|nr:nucleotidyltransferase domain-containing protein [Thermovirgaceae bacterium]
MKPAEKQIDTGEPDEHLLGKVVRIIVETVAPKMIILFGSAARKTMTASSDLDLLVIMPDGIHRRKTAQMIYRSLRGLGISKDIVVVTESDIEMYGDNPSLVIFPALREGRELYRVA